MAHGERDGGVARKNPLSPLLSILGFGGLCGLQAQAAAELVQGAGGARTGSFSERSGWRGLRGKEQRRAWWQEIPAPRTGAWTARRNAKLGFDPTQRQSANCQSG